MKQPEFRKRRPWLYLPVFVGLVFLQFSCTPKSTVSVEPGPDSQPKSLRLQKITAGEQNVQQYTYNAEGKLITLQTDWVYTDSLVTTSNTKSDLEYDTQQRLKQITTNGNFRVKFYYEGKLFDKTEEYDHKNRLVVTHFYLFNADGRLVELLDQIHNTDNDTFENSSFIKYRYTYDNRGNVQSIEGFSRRPGDSAFKATQTSYYEDYDDKKNPNNPVASYPFVPQESIQVNNPGKITTRNAVTQAVLSTEMLTYQYNAEGYPTQRTRQVTTTRTYPASTVYYHYE
ncbi:hypothetical protein [Larkinella rosea]|uniref:YD repeat-containing protein n=1 Tax=Larkinella rosea TaxID=2025312 RepID=A0A3P1BFJ4_9BACT|nr:hypothetical protein [Larkinella rosea]RRA99804.1 hypothetical protein EHT25_24535 [Larkinella rosea]